MDRIILAHSGSPATSAILHSLIREDRAEIVTLTVDLGQGSALDDVRERALTAGAVRAHVIDGREAFARDVVLPALQAGVHDAGRDPLGAVLGRVAIGRHLIDLARLENASVVAHGSTDDTWFETMLHAIEPEIEVLAPACGLEALPASAIATNLWARAVRLPNADDSSGDVSEAVYSLTKSKADALDVPAAVDLVFERGVPVAVNGVDMSLVELIQSLETIAGAHGVGRLDVVQRDDDGKLVRVVHEAPAAVVLHEAHCELQRLVTPRDLQRLTGQLGVKYTELIHDGLWYTPIREAIDAFIAKVQEQVSGLIRLELFKGGCRAIGWQPAHPSTSPPAPVAARMATSFLPL